MSCVSGDVTFEGSPTVVRYYFNYDGTVCEACTTLYATADEAHKNLREHSDYNKCTCGEPSVEVILHARYGDNLGITWYSTICEKCKAITGDRDVHAHLSKAREWGGGFG